MSFQEHTIKTEYRSLIDNVVQKFYCPLLKEAVSYKRAVGFFSSSSLIEISKGIADLASRDGRIQIVASPYLSDDDIEAIKKGYADRDEVIEAALLGQLSDEHTELLLNGATQPFGKPYCKWCSGYPNCLHRGYQRPRNVPRKNGHYRRCRPEIR